jgi:hypothetical protein
MDEGRDGNIKVCSRKIGGNMKELMLSLGAIVVGMLVTILVMIHGWGLEPKSWFWIIGVYLVGQTFAVMFIHASKK